MMLHKKISEHAIPTGPKTSLLKLNKVMNMSCTLDKGLKSGDPGSIFIFISTSHDC